MYSIHPGASYLSQCMVLMFLCFLCNGVAFCAVLLCSLFGFLCFFVDKIRSRDEYFSFHFTILLSKNSDFNFN